ncbi:MAG: ABC transporter permease [Palaeococcus sp.]|uniref:ABC-2 transporter permease n=1 Tax=Palaeococcus sp. (in: euryarchaeotes) TaxID=2820298 RepID=UPI0025D70651|nr:ABC-2 transporter permease [Palaeococcus sp. (in: euryarchaeotes)]MCD6558742.1 ABC transporter permease [Palaeococcus sp. (in: euryarchaeotes)]
MIKHIKWELDDYLNLSIFAFGFILLGVTLHVQALKGGPSFTVSPPEPEKLLHNSIIAMGISLPRLEGDSFIILALTGTLLASLILRYEKDSRVAMSIYSLPTKNCELVGAKIISGLILLILATIIPHFLASVYTYGDSPNLLKAALIDEGFLGLYVVYWFLASFYIIAVASFVAELSPNTFASILGGILVFYLPLVFNLSYLPPEILNKSFLIAVAKGTGAVNRLLLFLKSTFIPCLLVPMISIVLTLLAGEWRDVR